MAFDGNLLYVGKSKDIVESDNAIVFPIEHVKAESYNVLRSGQDLDSTRNANGNLIRNALSNFLMKVEISTKPLRTNKQLQEMLSILRDNYVNSTEKSIWVRAFIPETNSYMTQKCYVPDIQFNIYSISGTTIKYNSATISFIGYGKGE